jgi:hypothetical protein
MSLISCLLVSLTLSAAPVQLEFEGPLNVVLKKIAQKGGLNVVIAGDLDETVQVNLTRISAEEALESLSKTYGFSIEKQGKLWIVREGDGVEAEQAELPEPPEPPEAPEPPESAEPNAFGERGDFSKLIDQIERAKALGEALSRHEAARKAARHTNGDDDSDTEERDDDDGVVRTGSGEVRVRSGEVAKSAVSYGGPVIIEHDAVLNGDAVAMGGDVVIEKNAVVNGDAVSMGGHVLLHEGAVLNGARVSFGGSPSEFFAKNHGMLGFSGGPFRASGMMGPSHRRHHSHCKTCDTNSAQSSVDDDDEDSFGSRVAEFLLKFAGLFSLGFLLILFSPKRLAAMESAAKTSPVLNAALGAFGLVVAFGLSVLLMITIFGAPIGMALGLVSLLAIPVALAVIANLLGSLIPSGKLRRTQALVLALGTLLVVALGAVPFFGPLFTVAATAVGLGAMMRTRLGKMESLGPSSVESVNVPFS